MTKGKKRQVNVTREYDYEAKTVELKWRDGRQMKVALQGMSQEAVWKLAMLGVGELLTRRVDPEAAWEEIKAGRLGRQRKAEYSMIVQALARISAQYGDPLSLADCYAQWIALDAEEKKAMRADPAILQTIRRIQMERLGTVAPEGAPAAEAFFKKTG